MMPLPSTRGSTPNSAMRMTSGTTCSCVSWTQCGAWPETSWRTSCLRCPAGRARTATAGSRSGRRSSGYRSRTYNSRSFGRHRGGRSGSLALGGVRRSLPRSCCSTSRGAVCGVLEGLGGRLQRHPPARTCMPTSSSGPGTTRWPSIVSRTCSPMMLPFARAMDGGRCR